MTAHSMPNRAAGSGVAGGVSVGVAAGSAVGRRVESAGPSAGAVRAEPTGQGWRAGAGTGSRVHVLKAGSSSSAGRRTAGTAGRLGVPDARLWWRLIDRDRLIVSLLAEHHVLTTDQLAAVAFGSARRAQDRLARLTAMGLLWRFRFSLPAGGTSPAHYALGYVGARLVAAQRAAAPPRPAAWQQRLERLAESPQLRHRLGANGVFCGLAGYARTHPDQVAGADGVGGLTMWWPPERAARFFLAYPGGETVVLRPDGYGCWEAAGRVVRFFLEYDTGTESHTVLADKLAAYAEVPAARFGILAFTVHTRRREANLHRALRAALGAAGAPLQVATMSRDNGHPDGPAGPVWALWAQQRPAADGLRRYRLAELPQRGPRVAHHDGLAGQPFSQAAFSESDPEVVALIDP
jgi:hypothetical protein